MESTSIQRIMAQMTKIMIFVRTEKLKNLLTKGLPKKPAAGELKAIWLLEFEDLGPRVLLELETELLAVEDLVFRLKPWPLKEF